ncbi:MAG: hypothetical protein DLM61_06850 [Pseudonocardiales bacterium]|nr:MAG: hypothetical protein DLM61_06850 [Pseudonocardiales bacterium]
MGVTYKPDVGDIRESAAIEVLAKLARKGPQVSYHDPFVDRVDEHGLNLTSVALDAPAVTNADCVALLTPHGQTDLGLLVEHASLIFDARNAIQRRGSSTVIVL